MNILEDIIFLCTILCCALITLCTQSSKKVKNKRTLRVNECPTSNDTTTQTPQVQVPYSDFMFNISSVNTGSINTVMKENDAQVRYILTILVPENDIKSMVYKSRWGVCGCKFEQCVIVDHHNTRKDTHHVWVIERDGSRLELSDFIMKYSTEWPILHCGNNDGCRFMIVNGKFFLIGLNTNNTANIFLHRIKEWIC